MDKNEINQSTVRWLKKRFKDLTDQQIIEKARMMTESYLEEHKAQLEKREKLNREHFEKSIDKELLYYRLFGKNE